MDIFATFATDPEAEVKGRDFELSPTATVHVARSNTREYRKAMRKALNLQKVNLADQSDATEDAVEAIVIDVMAKHVLLGWSGLEYQGKTLEYSVANAKMLLQIPDFRAKIQSFADTADNFRVKAEVAQGNA